MPDDAAVKAGKGIRLKRAAHSLRIRSTLINELEESILVLLIFLDRVPLGAVARLPSLRLRLGFVTRLDVVEGDNDLLLRSQHFIKHCSECNQGKAKSNVD